VKNGYNLATDHNKNRKNSSQQTKTKKVNNNGSKAQHGKEGTVVPQS